MKNAIPYLALVVVFSVNLSRAATGDTRICKWKDCKVAAFSIGGDDSLRSQTTFAIPLMTQRGIHGTWWVNTGRGHNELGFDFIDDEAYWAAAVKAGHDLANHTLHHTGARDAADAVWEIGENARRIWAIQPQTKMLLFERGGGTVWDTSEEQIKHILDKYHCIDGRGAIGIDSPAWQINHTAAELRGFVDAAIHDGNYHYIIFHGIGSKAEWGGQTDGEAFASLLDYLVEKRDLVWTETFTKIYKYGEERDHSGVEIKESSANRVRLALTADLDTSPGMFDYPITLRTEVPAEWKTCTVTQGNHSTVYYTKSGEVTFLALPNAGDIEIHSGGTPSDPPANGLPKRPPSPPAPPVLPTRVIEDFGYSSDTELNSAWWVVPCGNKTRVSLDTSTTTKKGMRFSYAAGDKGVSGRLRRNTSLDLSPYKYVVIRFKPSSANDLITLQFMEALQSEFWEATFKPNSTDDQTVVIPLTREYFRHPTWFFGAEADGVIDLSNIKLLSLFVSGSEGGDVIFRDIEALQEKPSGFVPSVERATTTPFTATGRCALENP